MVKVAILHEGNSNKTNDNALLKLLIKDLGFDSDRAEFFGFGSKSNFFKIDNPKYQRLKLQIEEAEISKVLFVVDTDYKEKDTTYGGFENTNNELDKVINTLEIESRSNIYITCDPSQKDGYLESLILSTISNEQKECIENFLECSEFKSKENDKSVYDGVEIVEETIPFNSDEKQQMRKEKDKK